RVVAQRLPGRVPSPHAPLPAAGAIADEPPQPLEPLDGDPEPPRREEAVSAAPGLGRLLDDEHARARLARRERGAHGGVAATHHDDVVRRGHGRALTDDLADLDLRLDVRVVRDVGHDLLAVLAHPLLEIGERVEVEVAGGDVGRRRAGRATGDTLVDLGPTASVLAVALADQ